MSFRAFSVIVISIVTLNGCGITQLGPAQRHHFEHSALNFEFTSTYPRSRETLRLAEAFLPPRASSASSVATSPVPPRALSATYRTPRRTPDAGALESSSPVVVEHAPEEKPLEESLDDILGSPAPSIAALAPTVMNAASEPALEEKDTAEEAVASTTDNAPSAVKASESPTPESRPEVAALPTVREEAEVASSPTVDEESSVDAHQKSTDDRRNEIADAARRLVGVQKDFTSESLLAHVLQVNGVEVKNTRSTAFNRDFFRSLRNRGLSYDTERPSVGDIVFFHNTRDVNADGRNNDWYSATGVITDVSSQGTVTFVSVVNEEVRKLVMNLGRPEVRRDEAEQSVLNSYLRSRKMSDPEYTQYLAGELFAGYASVALP